MVSAYSIDAMSVTNADFARFVDATGYQTEADTFGTSAVFHLAVAAAAEDVCSSVAGMPWSWAVRGADWRHRGGPASAIHDTMDHPVAQVSWNDAHACRGWAGRRPPTEAGWEHAARCPRGDDLCTGDPRDKRSWRTSSWRGAFPRRECVGGRAPHRRAGGDLHREYGLRQMVGHVWEWCTDWWDAEYPRTAPRDPTRPAIWRSPVMRRGLYLCHRSYGNRYRVSARLSFSPDFSMANAGFRSAGSAQARWTPTLSFPASLRRAV